MKVIQKVKNEKEVLASVNNNTKAKIGRDAPVSKPTNSLCGCP